jgi:exopolysaccharide biosynthesis polyprenyl glycosylphosphotransferase
VTLKILLWKAVITFSYGLKRAIDFFASAVAISLGSPVFLITALLIKLEDGGPVFFRQERVGYRGRIFGMWKFRSMVTNAEAVKKQLEAANEMQGGVLFKMKLDPRVTRVGRFIRKFSIDELPQLWNVLAGDMSLVGPRPPLPREVAEYRPEERQRLLAKPGLTCLWQVSGRSEIDFAGQVKLDLEYIRSTSIWTDVKLLLMTVPAVLLGKGAY